MKKTNTKTPTMPELDTTQARNPTATTVRTRPVVAVNGEARSRTLDVSGEDKAAYLLRQVAERLSISLTQALRPFKQSPSVYRVLIALTRRNPATMRELIELTMIEPSTLSRTIAKMEPQGLVTSSPVEGDGRAVLVTLTDIGRAQLEAILPAASAQYDWAVHDIPAEDLEVMRATLQKMLRNLKISPIK